MQSTVTLFGRSKLITRNAVGSNFLPDSINDQEHEQFDILLVPDSRQFPILIDSEFGAKLIIHYLDRRNIRRLTSIPAS